MAPPTRTEFLRSRLCLCCSNYIKRNEEKMKHIQELLEKVDQKKKRTSRPPRKNFAANRLVIPAPNDRGAKNRNSNEDAVILAAKKEDFVLDFDEANGEHVLTVGGITTMKFPTAVFDRAKPYQQKAVKWAARVGPVGGILADDMGMGKTFMAIVTIGGRMRVNRVRMVLIVTPVSVLAGWAEEAKKFLPMFKNTVRIMKVHGGNRKDRQKTMRNAWRNSTPDKPHVIITSWGLAGSARTMTMFSPPTGHYWDYCILDEAHEIKNHKSTRSKCVRRICHKAGTRRLCLTGTPFQNSTDELWSITHMATAGKVLGKFKDFNKLYGKPIRDARCRSASSYAIKEGDKKNIQLQSELEPYLLRRRKLDFLSNELPPKHETCVWVKPSQQQARMYKKIVEENFALSKDILSSDTALAKKARVDAFQVLAQLRNLCGHPLRLLKGGPEGDIRSVLEQTPLASIINGSRKLELALHMLKAFKFDGEKTLLFSQSTKNLDVIQHVLLKQDFAITRLDGSVSEKRRQDMVKCFQDGMFDVFLLSTGAGGIGLTLTRASRVMVYDPSWNPSVDIQAVDRAYRIGQTREVRVYRLFLAGGIEEKMYEKQVHKSGLEKTIFTEGGGKAETRYFDKHELCKVFAQVPDGSCELLKKFEKEGTARVVDAHRHNKLVRDHPSVVGISNHGTIYHQKRRSAFEDARDAKRPKTSSLPANVVSESESSDAAPASEEAAKNTSSSCQEDRGKSESTDVAPVGTNETASSSREDARNDDESSSLSGEELSDSDDESSTSSGEEPLRPEKN